MSSLRTPTASTAARGAVEYPSCLKYPPAPAQIAGRTRARPSSGADVGGASPVPVQMWALGDADLPCDAISWYVGSGTRWLTLSYAKSNQIHVLPLVRHPTAAPGRERLRGDCAEARSGSIKRTARGREAQNGARARACRRRDGREARRACRRWTQEGTHGVPPTHPRIHALRYSCLADRTCRKWRNSRFRLVCSSAGRSSTSISLSRYLRVRALPTIAPPRPAPPRPAQARPALPRPAPAQPPSERCSSGGTAGGCGLGLPRSGSPLRRRICGLALPCLALRELSALRVCWRQGSGRQLCGVRASGSARLESADDR